MFADNYITHHSTSEIEYDVILAYDLAFPLELEYTCLPRELIEMEQVLTSLI